MKSKFEKELQKKAYNSVPDKWEELKAEVSDIKTEAPEKKIKHINYKPYIAAAASLIVVIACAVGIKVFRDNRVRTLPESKIQENGTAVVSFTDENGVAKTTIAQKVEGEDDVYIDNEGNQFIIDEKTTKIIAASSQTNSSSVTNSTTEIRTIPDPLTTTAAETRVEKDDSWSKWSLPTRFNVVVYNGKEYVYPGDRYETFYNFRTPTVLKKNVTLKATDNYDKEFTQSVDLVSLQGFGTNLVIGVKFPNIDYPCAYLNVSYKPANLGQLMNDLDWENTVTYGRIKSLGERMDMPVSPGDVLEMLTKGKSAANIESFEEPVERYVTLTVSVNELSIYDKYLRIYENGYVTTNIIGYRFCFYIGAKAAADYLMKSYNMSFAELDGFTQPQQPVTGADGMTSLPYMPTTRGYFGSEE